MDSQETARAPGELQVGQSAAMVNQAPSLAGPPRFPPPSNGGPADGPPRFPQPPVLRHLDSRSQLLPQGLGPRPPPQSFAPQRAPPPRNVFFGRPPQPGPPIRFPPGQPPPGVRPFNPQGFPNRGPFPAQGPVRGPPPNWPGNFQPPPQLRPQMSIERMADGDGHPRSEERPKSAVSTDGSIEKIEKIEKIQEVQQKVQADDAVSIKGFDDGQIKSLSSPAKKRTTFADEKPELEIAVAKTEESKSNVEESGAPKTDAENDSGVDESTQRRDVHKTNGLSSSPTKKSRDFEKRSAAGSPIKSPSKSIKSLPKTPDSGAAPSTAPERKIPMNKVQVGAAPSPNLKAVRSKIGSLDNTTYKPGGGKVKIENRKLDFSKAQPKIAAKNEKYMPSGGDKKIQQVKLQWNAKPKIGSLENASYKPGGGDKKIETVKLDFKDKAKPKVGSKDNAKHVPGGGTIKSTATPPKTPQDNVNNIETQKLDIKAESKIGSLDNVKYKPGGGDKKIFDDKTYLRQTSSSNVGSVSGSGSQSPIPSGSSNIMDKNGLTNSDEHLYQAI